MREPCYIVEYISDTEQADLIEALAKDIITTNGQKQIYLTVSQAYGALLGLVRGELIPTGAEPKMYKCKQCNLVTSEDSEDYKVHVKFYGSDVFEETMDTEQ